MATMAINAILDNPGTIVDEEDAELFSDEEVVVAEADVVGVILIVSVRVVKKEVS